MEVAPPLERHLAETLSDLESRDLRRARRVLRWVSPTRAEIDGRVVQVFGDNDYLGLASRGPLPHPHEPAALEGHGPKCGAGASRLVTGTSSAHTRLEEALAAFMGTPAALLFNSGYNANSGLFSALLGPDDVVFSDARNHASLIDGVRLCRARRVVFPHNDLDALASALEESKGSRLRLIVVESIYSMDGDAAPLAELCELARAHEAALVVDEAHAIGVFGPEGQGLCAALGLESAVAARVGTCGKSFGSFGAFVAGSEALVEVLYNRARSFVFTTALPPVVVEATLAALPLLRSPERRQRLHHNLRRLHDGLFEAGLLEERPLSPVVPIVVGSSADAVAVSERLWRMGILVPAIRPPTVPPGTARLRVTLSAEHCAEEIDGLVAALREAMAKK